MAPHLFGKKKQLSAEQSYKVLLSTGDGAQQTTSEAQQRIKWWYNIHEMINTTDRHVKRSGRLRGKPQTLMQRATSIIYKVLLAG